MPDTKTVVTTTAAVDLKSPDTSASSDVALSIANHIFAMAAAYLMAKGWNEGTIAAAQGAAMAVISFGIGFWMNSGSVTDLATSALRKVLTIALTFATARGWISGDIATTIAGMAATTLPVIWSAVFYGKAPGPSLPGTTIVDTGPDEIPVKVADLTADQVDVLAEKNVNTRPDQP